MADGPALSVRIRDPEGERLDLWRRRAVQASVAVAAMLIAAKLTTFLLTDSVSVLSSLVDSTVDAVASLVTLLGVTAAQRPADTMHRYGHGKAEALAALAQAAFVTGSGVFLGLEGLNRLVDPRPVTETTVGIGVMAGSIVLTGALVLFQRWVIRKTGSLAVGADSLHYRGDLLMNLAVIAALTLSAWTGSPYWDPVFGLAIAAWLMVGAWHIGHLALDVLMDRELPEADRRRVVTLVQSHRATRGLHDLRTRSTGVGQHVEFHLELDSHLTLAEAHDITDEIESALREAFPQAEFTIHQEPAGLEDDRLDHRVAAGEAMAAGRR